MKTRHTLIIGISTLLVSAVVSSGQTKTDAESSTNTTAKASVTVPLKSFFNCVGITKDGAAVTGGVDDGGNACSTALLGTSQTAGGVTFKIGPADGSNVVTTAGQIIPLPSGAFSSLHLLMIAVNGNQESQNFLVTYSDNTVQTNTQSVSDWFTPNAYPTETQAVSMAYRNASDGTKDEQQCYVFDYSFSLNKTNTVKSVTLPSNANVKIFALTLVP
jgi:hypothetical protein